MSNSLDSLWYTIYRSLPASIIRSYWHRLWVRENELHTSLKTDIDVIYHLEREDIGGRIARFLLGFASRKEYDRDLNWRRTIAGERDVSEDRPSYHFYSHLDRFIYSLRKMCARNQSFDQTSKRRWF